MTQERMTDADEAKVTGKKYAKKSSNADKNKVNKNNSWKYHAMLQAISHSLCI